VNVPVWLDCVLEHIEPFDHDANSPPPPYEGGIFIVPRLSVLSWSCINRHEGGVNCLFLDWSVRKVGLKELWTLKWNAEFNTAGPWTRAGGVQPEDWPPWMRKFKDY
jgi:prepilin-type processing-associated H-X9-DG protein